MIQENHFTATLVNFTCAAILTALFGWLLILGRTIFLPILVGVIAVYVLTTAADALGRIPMIGRLSCALRRLIVGLLSASVVVLLIATALEDAQSIAASLSKYNANLQKIIGQISTTLGIENVPSLAGLIGQAQSSIDLNAIASSMALEISGVGTFIATSVLYAAFLLIEWNDLPQKMRRSVGNEEKSGATIEAAKQINIRIGGYLTTKSNINIILGLISFLIMWLLGIDYAVFWSILIALLNYIPYIGSVLGVFFPVMMTMAQFGTLSQTAIAFSTLMGAQLLVGNVLEPKMLGRSMNMSPFVVLVSLSFWMSIWGIIGAILAIPLTSIAMFIFAEIPRTRPIVAMMSEDGNI